MRRYTDSLCSKMDRSIRGIPGKPVSRILYPRESGGGGHSSGPEVAFGFKQPTRESIPRGNPRQETSRAGSAPLFGLAPDGVCQAAMSPPRRCALTAPFHPCPSPDNAEAKPGDVGGVFSVALSVGSPRLPVRKHPALRCSDFPPGAVKPRATTRLPGEAADRTMSKIRYKAMPEVTGPEIQ